MSLSFTQTPASRSDSESPFTPHSYQVKINYKNYLTPLHSIKKKDLEVDVLFAGGGPAGLAGAIYLQNLCQKQQIDIQIAVMEKARAFGGHTLSGAIINPVCFRQLFPHILFKDLPFRQKIKKESLFYLGRNNKFPLPVPPMMKNKNFYTASLCEVTHWMAKKAEAAGITLLPAFTAHKLITEDEKVAGVLTFQTGLSKNQTAEVNAENTFSIKAKLTVLADGSRGHLSRAWMQWKNILSKYPETYALGVKELWECKNSNWASGGQVIHTMGWPLRADCFGGGWLYPMGENMVSVGLVAGLDSPSQNLDVHQKLQDLKMHPLFANILKDGRCEAWGAKTIPEGGYHSIPNQLHDHGVLVVGDAGGMVNVPALKGIHYAMHSGILAAEEAFDALRKNDFSMEGLKGYSQKVRHGTIGKELYPVRNVRRVFDKNIFIGLIKSGLMFLTKGRFPGDAKQPLVQDSHVPRVLRDKYYAHKHSSASYISKADAVYLSGNKTRDDIPSHLKNGDRVPIEVQKFYERLCPAGVYESKNGKLIINAPNCIDCKATDVWGPGWTPREGGTGPHYRQM